ncbi:hypothetical protein BISU_1614 [Bifidobacterium subtile]|uniref:Uncharacterized protein n=1 Tax=Bifidobacterium subtile TaxID=77635 RepID=A0A087EBD5_9BIFI|nr:hypothetical protein BISU_1614 [Bifidobacterium subtile]
MAIMTMMTIPGLDNSEKLQRVRKESMRTAHRNLSRQTRSRLTMTALAKLAETRYPED